jgi:DNA-directed RNA polymerase subunit K/omega
LRKYGNIDSKFRFVLLASKRAKMLLKGAKSKIKTKSKSPIRIAQAELQQGLVSFEILKPKKEEVVEQEEQTFLGDSLAEGTEGAEEETPPEREEEEEVAEEEEENSEGEEEEEEEEEEK